jgi:type I restriction enzyme S subunit
MPSLDKQVTVAANINALAAETQQLTRIYEQKLAALAELKKSLLHQAFSGEL